MKKFSKFTLFILTFSLNAILGQAADERSWSLNPSFGILPDCLFSSSGLGKKSSFGLRAMCEGRIGLGLTENLSGLEVSIEKLRLIATPRSDESGQYLGFLDSNLSAFTTTKKINVLDDACFISLGLGYFRGYHKLGLSDRRPLENEPLAYKRINDSGYLLSAAVGTRIQAREGLFYNLIAQSSLYRGYTQVLDERFSAVSLPILKIEAILNL